jgi:hypothetical protein
LEEFNPCAIPLDIIESISLMDFIESSFPGIGISIKLGSQFVSTIAIT